MHEKFTDPLIDEAVFSVARLKARAKHHRRVVHLTRTLAKAPLYFVPSAKNGTVASLKKRKGNPSNSSNSAVLNSDEAIKAEVLKGKVPVDVIDLTYTTRPEVHCSCFIFIIRVEEVPRTPIYSVCCKIYCRRSSHYLHILHELY